MFSVYILKSVSSGKFYIGQTNDIDDRIIRHNENRVRATRKRGPWELVYEERHSTRGEVLKREIYLKKRKDKEYIKKIIAGWRNGTSAVS